MIAKNMAFEKASLIIVLELLVLLYQHQCVLWLWVCELAIVAWFGTMAGGQRRQVGDEAQCTHSPLKLAAVLGWEDWSHPCISV